MTTPAQVLAAFTIPGPPIPKERPRRAKDGHWYTPPRTVRAEEDVGYQAMAAGLKLEPEMRYGVDIEFHLSTLGRDIDNCAKLVLDGLGRMGKPSGWNDRQVVVLHSRIVAVADGREERTVVRVERLEDAMAIESGGRDGLG